MSDNYVEIWQSREGEWRWHRKAGNNEIVSESGESFGDKAYAEESAKAYNGDVEPANITFVE